MDPPFGHVNHHRHHHHNRRDDDFENDNNTNYPPPPPPPFSSSPYPPPPSFGGDFNQPPPPFYGGGYNQPPPPSYGGGYNQPPPPSYGGAYDQAPPPPLSHHNNHSYGNVVDDEERERTHHNFRPHMPEFIQEHFNNSRINSDNYDGPTHHGHGGGSEGSFGGGGGGMDSLANKPSFKIYCKAGGDRLHVGIRDDKIILLHPDHNDPTQHWYKDERYSTRVKDKDGYPSFYLVNKGTGQVAKHPVSGHPVQLVPYKPDVFDESVLWTESKDLGSGFRTIRSVSNIKLVMDAWNADQSHGGIHDGTIVALFDVWKGDNQNQQWKIVPYCKSL